MLMDRVQLPVMLAFIFMAQMSYTLDSPSPTPSAGPSVAPSSAVSGVPKLGAAAPALTTAVKIRLLLQFQRAQFSERRALAHRQRMEMKELDASIGARRKDFREKERIARQEYQAKGTKGPEIRVYMKGFYERRDAFEAMLKTERKNRQNDFEVAFKAFKGEQAEKSKKFNEYLSKGEIPPHDLWPK